MIKINIKKLLKKSDVILYLNDTIKKYYYRYLINNERYLKRKFKKRLGRELNLDNPEMYNDKLQWLKLYWYNPIAIQCADKYGVRDIVKRKIGQEYLNDLIAVYDDVTEIDIDQLPESFVLKGTHGSGFNIICKNKSEINWKLEYKKMKRWLRINYYDHTKEWVYKDIKPRIICEKYMEDSDTGELRDYKFFCFDGEPKIMQVDFGRFENHKRNIYDMNWNLLDVEIGYPSDSDADIKKPGKFNEMIELSRKLSKGFPHVRVDFYDFNGKVIFGELTFFHNSGYQEFTPLEYERILGSYLKI